MGIFSRNSGGGYMLFRFSKEIYNKEAVLKAAYQYTDRAFLHIDVDDTHYIVTVELKSKNETLTEEEFQNEVLAQMVRQQVRVQTKNVRELMLARAFSSTIVEETPEYEPNEQETFETDINDILTDWFEKYE
jgi:His-Xaa-Ser system protein HxsD